MAPLLAVLRFLPHRAWTPGQGRQHGPLSKVPGHRACQGGPRASPGVSPTWVRPGPRLPGGTNQGPEESAPPLLSGAESELYSKLGVRGHQEADHPGSAQDTSLCLGREDSGRT